MNDRLKVCVEVSSKVMDEGREEGRGPVVRPAGPAPGPGAESGGGIREKRFSHLKDTCHKFEYEPRRKRDEKKIMGRLSVSYVLRIRRTRSCRRAHQARAFFDLTGTSSAIGTPTKLVAEMVAKKINDEGGINGRPSNWSSRMMKEIRRRLPSSPRSSSNRTKSLRSSVRRERTRNGCQRRSNR